MSSLHACLVGSRISLHIFEFNDRVMCQMLQILHPHCLFSFFYDEQITVPFARFLLILTDDSNSGSLARSKKNEMKLIPPFNLYAMHFLLPPESRRFFYTF